MTLTQIKNDDALSVETSKKKKVIKKTNLREFILFGTTQKLGYDER